MTANEPTTIPAAPVKTGNFNLDISDRFRALLRGFEGNRSDPAIFSERTLSLYAFSAREARQPLGPRGTLEDTAESVIGEENERALHVLFDRVCEQRRKNDDLSYARRVKAWNEAAADLALVMGQLGGETSARFLRDRLEVETNDRVARALEAGLECVGGPVAVSGLVRAAIVGTPAVADGALYHLRELGTGGDYDLGGPPPVVPDDFQEQVRKVNDWGYVWKDVSFKGRGKQSLEIRKRLPTVLGWVIGNARAFRDKPFPVPVSEDVRDAWFELAKSWPRQAFVSLPFKKSELIMTLVADEKFARGIPQSTEDYSNLRIEYRDALEDVRLLNLVYGATSEECVHSATTLLAVQRREPLEELEPAQIRGLDSDRPHVGVEAAPVELPCTTVSFDSTLVVHEEVEMQELNDDQAAASGERQEIPQRSEVADSPALEGELPDTVDLNHEISDADDLHHQFDPEHTPLYAGYSRPNYIACGR